MFFIGFSVLLFACDMEPKTYTEEISRMEDTLFKSFPTVNRVSVEARSDFGLEVNITLGDVTLYNSPEEKKKETAQKAALITEHIFSGSKPKKGKVIFVAEENTLVVDEDSQIIVPMLLPGDR